jgi:hypothetical protein
LFTGLPFLDSSRVRSTTPVSPNERIGCPVDASSAMRFHRLFMKIRRVLPSVHVATPRWTNPVPFGGWPAA